MTARVPMRAADLKGDISKVRCPAYLSPKLDGYRATVQLAGGKPTVLSKNNKPIPNAYVQARLGRADCLNLDGELIVGSPTDSGSLQRTSSGVTTRTGEPAFTFWVFDDLTAPHEPFRLRLERLKERSRGFLGLPVRLVPHVLCATPAELAAFEAECVGKGYEGVMVRSPEGVYKQGGVEPRSTVAELYVAKLKRKDQFEARVLAVHEQMENTNAAQRDELGRLKRSSAKAGKRGTGVLGSCEVVGLNGRWKGVKFDVGTGFSDEQRAALWEQHLISAQLDRKGRKPTGHAVVGRAMKVESGVTPATFNKPQFPRFVDWKWEGDL